MFVGAVSDNFDERIEQKIFHAQIVVDNEKVAAETKAYKKIPTLTNFIADDGTDLMEQKIQENYGQIKLDVKQIVEDELDRIMNDENLRHLIKE